MRTEDRFTSVANTNNRLHRQIGLRTILFHVMLRGFFRMVSGMQMVTMRDVCMMPGLFMAPSSVVLGRFL